MKIGIMTFWQTNNNYGQILQLYALQRTLIKCSHSPVLIRYYLIRKYKSNWRRNIKHLFEFSRYTFFIYSLMHREQDRGFEDFRKSNLIFTPDIYLSIDEFNVQDFDAFIVGSDQVWNYTLFGDDPDPAFFLQFVPDYLLKISYAASFGFPILPAKYEKKNTKLVKIIPCSICAR